MENKSNQSKIPFNEKDVLTRLTRIRRASENPPTHVPKNAFEQIYYQKSGSTFVVYHYIEGSWCFQSLTEE